MTQTHELLREYRESGSEAAFRQIVDLYIDLVFSTALRRLNGDRHRAEDATQIVFTDLARKAKTLSPEVMLGGWLHRHCSFVVNNLTRAETRRAAREKEAVAMESLHHHEASWVEVSPELDRAIDSLQPEDRDAIVLRFFERRDFKAIGEAIGGSENAAQKRVTRALEKLRQLLAERGVALSVGGLSAALTSEAMAAAPAALAEKASAEALRHAGAKSVAMASGVAGSAIALWVLIGAVALTAVVVGVVATKSKVNADAIAQTAIAQTEAGVGSENVSLVTTGEAVPGGTEAASVATETGPAMRLVIVAADTGNAVPNVAIEYRAMVNKRNVRKDIVASRAGIAVVSLSDDATELELVTRTEAFADTRLFWRRDNGEFPREYTLRLKRGVPIGGKVINSRGELVPGAAIDFDNPVPDAALSQNTESHEVNSVHIVAEDGTWQTSRIPEGLLRRMNARATHPDYAGSETAVHPTPASEVDLFLNSKHVFRMRDGVSVRGIVVNEKDEPIGGANVLVGGVHFTGSREGTAGADGQFEIRGCEPRETVVTASAKGYGAKTLRVDMPPKEDGYKIVLEPARVLKMRIVNMKGEPVPNATAAYITMEYLNQNRTNTPIPQVSFRGKSDAEGRIEWAEAPATELTFDFWAKGHMRKSLVKIPNDEAEHTITMLNALKITGTVRDGMTGAPIPKFRVISGWAESLIMPGETKPNIHWSRFERDWLHGANGQFERTIESSVIYGADTNRFCFKIEADGYRALTTRIVEEGEEQAHFDVRMQRGGAVMLTFVGPDGRPAPDVDVAFPRTRALLQLNARAFARGFGDPVLITDSKGQVAFPAEETSKIIAAGMPGFVILNPAEIPVDGTIRLQAWGRVQGKVTRRGKPITDWKLQISTDFQRDKMFLRTGDFATDSEGNFVIEYAPPGAFKLTRQTRVDESGAWSNTPLCDVGVVPGETTTANYEEKGFAATLKIRWPDGIARSPKDRVFVGATNPLLQPSREIMGNPAALAEWRERPDVKAAIAKMRGSGFIEKEPGVWSAENLEPGEWTLNATVIDQTARSEPGKPAPALFVGTRTVRVPENFDRDSIDLGELVLMAGPGTQPQ